MTKRLDEATKLANKQKLIAKKLEEKNEAFNALSKKKKAVEIAKDVIAQIKAEKFKATHKGYYNGAQFKKFKEQQLQEVLLSNNAPKCTCCAIGSVMLSMVRKCNNLTAEEAYEKWNYSSAEDLAKNKGIKAFSKNQLELMEVAFEGFIVNEHNTTLYTPYVGLTILAEKAIAFGEKHKRPNKRLIAIMENVILNSGTFKP